MSGCPCFQRCCAAKACQIELTEGGTEDIYIIRIYRLLQEGHRSIYICLFFRLCTPFAVCRLQDEEALAALFRQIQPSALFQELRGVHAVRNGNYGKVGTNGSVLRDIELHAAVFADTLGEVTGQRKLCRLAQIHADLLDGIRVDSCRAFRTSGQSPLADAVTVSSEFHVRQIQMKLIAARIYLISRANFQIYTIFIYIQIRSRQIVPGSYLDAGMMIHTPGGELPVLVHGGSQVVLDPLIRITGLFVEFLHHFQGMQAVGRVCHEVLLTVQNPEADTVIHDRLDILIRPVVLLLAFIIVLEGSAVCRSDAAVIYNESIHDIRILSQRFAADTGSVGVALQNHILDVVILREPLQNTAKLLTGIRVLGGVYVRRTDDDIVRNIAVFRQLLPCGYAVVIGYIGTHISGYHITVCICLFIIRSTKSGIVEYQCDSFFGILVVILIAVRYIVVYRDLTIELGVLVRIYRQIEVIQRELVQVDIIGIFPYGSAYAVAEAVGQSGATLRSSGLFVQSTLATDEYHQIQIISRLVSTVGIRSELAGCRRFVLRLCDYSVVLVTAVFLRIVPGRRAQHAERLIIRGLLGERKRNCMVIHRDVRNVCAALFERAVRIAAVPYTIAFCLVRIGHVRVLTELDRDLIQSLTVEVRLRRCLNAYHIRVRQRVLLGCCLYLHSLCIHCLLRNHIFDKSLFGCCLFGFRDCLRIVNCCFPCGRVFFIRLIG